MNRTEFIICYILVFLIFAILKIEVMVWLFILPPFFIYGVTYGNKLLDWILRDKQTKEVE